TGAAISIVITEVLSLTLFNYLFNKGIVFKLHLKTVGKALEKING
ncbi:TPA: polysaccharide biosynthesis protein, partial [Escherichia coli]